MILALDTCLDTFGVALTEGDRCLAEVRGGRPKTHLTQLFPALEAALKIAGVQLTDLNAVAVTVGPGSFTGVRLGVLAARTLGQTRGLSLIPINTLSALAMNCPGQELTVAIDVRKGEICWGRSLRDGHPLSPPRIGPPEQFLQAEHNLILGNALERYPHPCGLPPDFWLVKPSLVGILAATQPATTWQKLLPEYLRDADVQVQR